MAKLHLGIDVCFTRKRWTSPDEWMPIVKKKLGLNYIEFCADLIDPFFTTAPERYNIAKGVKKLSEKYGITIFDNYTGVITHCVNLLSHPMKSLRERGVEWCTEAMKIAKLIGARGLGGHLDTIPYNVWTREGEYKKALNRLIGYFRRLAVIAKKHGNSFLLWEQMYTPNEVPYTISQANEIYEKANKNNKGVPIYLTLDVGHACCQNYKHSPEDTDPYEWLKRFAHVSPVIHLQQVNGKSSPHWPFTEKYNKIGIIKGEKVLEAIEKSGSKENYLMLEIFHSLGTNENILLDDLKRSVEYWRKFVKD